MKQDISKDPFRKLNEVNHDYQRMRKIATKRRDKILTRINKDRAKQEREAYKKLGSEAWVDVKGTWKERLAWVVIGLLIGFWIH